MKAFLLAQRPANIRMIGQAPVIGTTVFDMASDSETFRVSIPSKNKFLIGSVALERAEQQANRKSAAATFAGCAVVAGNSQTGNCTV